MSTVVSLAFFIFTGVDGRTVAFSGRYLKTSVTSVKESPQVLTELGQVQASTYCQCTVSKAHKCGRKLAPSCSQGYRRSCARRYQVPDTRIRTAKSFPGINQDFSQVAVRSHYSYSSSRCGALRKTLRIMEDKQRKQNSDDGKDPPAV